MSPPAGGPLTAGALRRRALGLLAAAGRGVEDHSLRVGRLAGALAEALGLPAGECAEVELAALLHDVGKAVLPEALLAKAAPLDAAEWALMRGHTVEGEHMVSAAGLPRTVALTVRWSHERWDGAGYPDGLAGERIPAAARVVFCADAYDAMTSPHPYRPALGPADAVAELRRGAGAQFEPRVAGLLAALVERLGGPPLMPVGR